MSERGSIEGRVVDTAGVPLGGARVAVAEGDQPYHDIAAVTDAGGRFRLGQILPGSYRVAAHYQQRTGSAQVVVRSGQATETEIRVP